MLGCKAHTQLDKRRDIVSEGYDWEEQIPGWKEWGMDAAWEESEETAFSSTSEPALSDLFSWKPAEEAGGKEEAFIN